MAALASEKQGLPKAVGDIPVLLGYQGNADTHLKFDTNQCLVDDLLLDNPRNSASYDFEIALKRNVQSQPVGIAYSFDNGPFPRITEVQEVGLIADWNAQQTHNTARTVQIGDRIIEVNGFNGFVVDHLVDTLKHDRVIKLMIRRHVETAQLQAQITRVPVLQSVGNMF